MFLGSTSRLRPKIGPTVVTGWESTPRLFILGTGGGTRCEMKPSCETGIILLFFWKDDSPRVMRGIKLRPIRRSSAVKLVFRTHRTVQTLLQPNQSLCSPTSSSPSLWLSSLRVSASSRVLSHHVLFNANHKPLILVSLHALASVPVIPIGVGPGPTNCARNYTVQLGDVCNSISAKEDVST